MEKSMLVSNSKWNILALVLLGGLFFYLAGFEGYWDIIAKSNQFLIFFAAVFLVCLVTCLNTNGIFFLWLLVFGFFVGLISQIMGTFNNLWIYTGKNESYIFTGFLWAFSAAAMHGLSLALMRLFPEMKSNRYNVLCLIILFLVIPVFLGRFRTAANLNFWIYYVCVFVFSAVATARLKFSALLSLVLAAWVVGYITETIGSNIGLWTYCAVPDGAETARSIACWSPPPYLTFGCWPLIFIAQMGLSFFLSQEHLNMRSDSESGT